MTDAPERPRTLRDRQVDRRIAVLLLVLVGGIYLMTGHSTLAQNNDSRAAAIGAWSLGTQGTVALPDAWPAESVSWNTEGADGRLHVNRFPGVIAWGAPFYTAHAMLTGDWDAPPSPHLIDYRPALVAAATAAAGGIAIGFLLLRRLTDRWTALGASAVMAFATSTWSISGTALWTHGITHLMLALGMLALAAERTANSGLALGFAVFTRPQTAIIPAVLGLWEGVARRQVRPVLLMGVTSAIGLLGIVLYSRLVFDTWLPISGYGTYAVTGVVETQPTTQGRRILGALFDPRRGLLLYAPFLVLLLPGLRTAWRDAPQWVRSSAVAGILYFLLQLRLNDFDGGTYFFAYRLPLEMLVLSAPLLVLSFERFVSKGRVRLTAFAMLASVAVGLQVIGVTYVSSEAMARDFWAPQVEELCARPDVDCDPEELLPSLRVD